MLNFVVGILSGIFFGFVIFGSIYISTKSYKAKDLNYDRFMLVDNIWMRSLDNEKIVVSYNDKEVTVFVKSHSIDGTNNDAVLLQVFINDIYCACCLRCNDGENFYKLCYVNSDYDEVEVWNIIEAASKLAKQKEKEVKQKEKKSVLEDIT